MWSGGRIGNSETNGDRTFVQFARRSLLLLAAGVEARTIRMDGQAGMRRSLPAAERLRLHTSRKGMVREIVRRRAYRAVDVRAWAPQRSTASHVVQAGGQGPISVQRHERTPRIGGAAIGRSPERLSSCLSCPLLQRLCCYARALVRKHDEDAVDAS